MTIHLQVVTQGLLRNKKTLPDSCRLHRKIVAFGRKLDAKWQNLFAVQVFTTLSENDIIYRRKQSTQQSVKSHRRMDLKGDR